MIASDKLFDSRGGVKLSKANIVEIDIKVVSMATISLAFCMGCALVLPGEYD